MAFWRQKIVWIGLAAVLAAVLLFGLAMMGTVLGAKPNALPVALAVQDKGADLPGGGGSLNVGEMIRQRLEAAQAQGMPIEWTVVGTEEEARKGLDEARYYGALVLPADLSAGIVSAMGANPKPAVVKIYVNEGKNAQAAAVVAQALGQAMSGARTELAGQLLGQIGEKSPQIPISTAKALLAPFTVEQVPVHSAGANNAGGNAPNQLAQIAWVGSLFASVLMYLASRKAKESGGASWAVVGSQLLTGLVLTAAASAFLLWMAHSWYGMAIDDWAGGWLFLWLAAAAFFLLQTTLLVWIGFPAMGILVLLMFFSMPVIGVAPEFLPQAARDGVYAWTPLRFAAEGMRNLMYYGGEGAGMGNAYAALWGNAGTGAALTALSALRRSRPARGKIGEPAAGV